MENSFFEYRDKTGVESDSDTDVINASLVAEESFTCIKKTPGKNRTVFVAESEESNSDDETAEVTQNVAKLAPKNVNLPKVQIDFSSDDDTNKRGSMHRPSNLEMSFNKVVLSSSDDEEMQEISPEIVPKRRPPPTPQSNHSSDTSVIGRKKNKRLMLLDSESDNSIILEHNKNKKMQCLKATPLKVEDNKMAMRKMLNESVMDQSIEEDGSSGKEESSEEEQTTDSEQESESEVYDSDYDEAKTKTKINHSKKSSENITKGNLKANSGRKKKSVKEARSENSEEEVIDHKVKGKTNNRSRVEEKSGNFDKDNIGHKIKRKIKNQSVEQEDTYESDEDVSKDNNHKDQSEINNQSGVKEQGQESEDETDNIGSKPKGRIKNRNFLIDSDDEVDHQHKNNENQIENDATKQSYKEKNSAKKVVNKKSESDYETCDSDLENDKRDSESDESNEELVTDDDDGPDEDQMVMSRATRMSIMGIVPKGTDDSDDSDFIQSDETGHSSRDNDLTNSLNDLPDVTIAKDIPKTPIAVQKDPEKTPTKLAEDIDSSRISCSPIASPLHDITNEIDHIDDSYETRKTLTHSKQKENTNLSTVKKQKDLKSRVLNNLVAQKSLNATDENVKVANESLKENNEIFKATNESLKVTDGSLKKTVESFKVTDNDVEVVSVKNVVRVKSETVVDEDVTIVESTPEIIALSSDDDDDVTEVQPVQASSIKKSPSAKASQGRKDGTMMQYLAPPSYPNSQVIYVTKQVRENELAKLEGLKEERFNIRNLLENMDLETLPDGGGRLIERLTQLEQRVREQGNRVGNMVVEPEIPTAADIARDGFDPHTGLSWDELQRGSQAVQPRMFGKQAMATHMAERNLILERLRDLHESLASRPPESTLAPAPKAVKSTLMKHQLHALAWLRWRETQNPTGGILADDMGLGKTITMISLIVSDKESRLEEDDDDERGSSRSARGGTLVVCPASLVNQWSAEVTKHCTPHAASVCLHHGANRATHPHRLATYDIVLTTYNILQRDNEKNGVLMKVVWRRVILDEAHIVRNHKSATSAAVSALAGRRRWCLTGTPVQNRDLDLFALLKFLRCTPFDELTMWKKWIDNKSQGGQERLSTIMRCILLRRTKVQLQERGQLNCLPKRETHLKEVTLSKDEMNVYQKVLVFSKTLFAQFLHQRAEKQAAGEIEPMGKDSEYFRMHKRLIALQGAKPVKSHEILVLLLRLRQVCCHCGLIAAMLDEDSAGDGVAHDAGGEDLLAELNKLSLEDSRRKSKKGEEEQKEEEEGPEQEGTTVTEAIRSVLSPNNPVFELTRQSSKIKAVMKCLHENVFANKGHKAVVVSQWTSVLRLVEKELEKSRIKSVTLSGNVPVPSRPPLIDKLNDPNSEVRVMLLSLCAGGVGLNLCGANHLLLLDPHWNPQLEEQAQDRIYRVGQGKPVHIYRFMCVDTVEQSIRKLQQAKLELAENVLTGARNTNASKLTIEDLKLLFNMAQPVATSTNDTS